MWDGKVKGLGVKVFPSGAKSYVLDYRTGGQHRRTTLARVTELSLEAARKRAGPETCRRGTGRDPGRRREIREAPTVAEGLDRFFGDFVPERLRIGKLKERTVREYRIQADRIIRPAIGKLRIEAVTRTDIERMVKPLPPVQRNRVLAFASRTFGLFETWKLCGANPVRGIERAREEPRDRTLTEAEIAALGTALEAEGETNAAAVRFAAMTGLRIGEVIGMKWAEIDFEAGQVLLPDTKTGRRWQSLSTAALEALSTLPRVNEHVFTTGRTHITYKTGHGAFGRAAKRAGLSDVRLHDLRRTLMTRAAAAGMGAHVLRDLLGHKTAAMADRYIRRTGGAVADATERMGGEMAAILAGKPKADVLPIRRNG